MINGFAAIVISRIKYKLIHKTFNPILKAIYIIINFVII